MLREETIGHVGLKESVAMIAAGLGMRIDKINESIRPILHNKRVIGINQIAYAKTRSKKVIVLNLEMSTKAKQRDKILINGVPKIELEIKKILPQPALSSI